MKQRAGSKPGWYPDPLRRHQLRYWDGTRWTSDAADAGRWSLDPLPPAPLTAGGRAESSDSFWSRHHTAVRRVLWSVYAIPLTVLSLGVILTSPPINVLEVIDEILNIAALIVLYLHVWDRRTLPAAFWKVFAFGFMAWVLISVLVLFPAAGSPNDDPWILIVPLILLPLYIAQFRYAYRDWPTAK